MENEVRGSELIVFSDAHFSVDSRIEEERWFPPQCRWLDALEHRAGIGENLVKRFLEWWDRKTQQGVSELISRAAAYQTVQAIISCGDETPGTNESGLVTEKAREESQEFSKRIKRAFPGIPFLRCWGGHDLGYHHPTTSKLIGARGGVTANSIQWAQTLISPSFQRLEIDPFTIILLNSEVYYHHSCRDTGAAGILRRMAEEQDTWLEETRKCAGRILLFIHDPAPLPHIARCFGKNGCNKIAHSFCGHVHRRWVGSLLAQCTRHGRMFHLTAVPALWGFSFEWCGFLTATLLQDGRYTIQYQKIRSPRT